MRRRDFITAGAAAVAFGVSPAQAAAPAITRVRPGMPGWPSDDAWASLRKQTNGRLWSLADFVRDAQKSGQDDAKLRLNPFYVRSRPDLTQSSGWRDAWRSSPSAYLVAAETPADVAAAVRFAVAHNLRVVIRGGGHSYLGTSNAPDSLMIWTRGMNDIALHDAFVPTGSSAAPKHAVSLGAGCIWLHAYQAVTGGAGRYVQGGGCTTVGVTGLILGGGFGSFSKAFGLAAASLLEAEIVTADGTVRVVNEAKEPDLFWALKGGGGGTFGVVTRITLATHPLPSKFGAVNLTLRAKSDDAFRRLVAQFVDLYANRLFNPHWGEQARFLPDNRLRLMLVFQGLTKSEATDTVKPLVDFAIDHAADYDVQAPLSVADVPARYFWNAWVLRLFARSAVEFDDRPGASWTDFWWHGDGDQVGAFWNGYASAWLPEKLLDDDNRAALVEALFAASRPWGFSLHFNKGLAGAPDDVRAAARDTAMNPDVVSAFALAIAAAQDTPALSSLGVTPVMAAKRVGETLAALRTAAPATGSYVNECDYFEADWQRAFWGANYARLADIKAQYDPDGLFYVHHGVGSEGWSSDGFSRTG